MKRGAGVQPAGFAETLTVAVKLGMLKACPTE